MQQQVRAIRQTGGPPSNVTLNPTEELASQLLTQADIEGIDDASDAAHPQIQGNNHNYNNN